LKRNLDQFIANVQMIRPAKRTQTY